MRASCRYPARDTLLTCPYRSTSDQRIGTVTTSFASVRPATSTTGRAGHDVAGADMASIADFSWEYMRRNRPATKSNGHNSVRARATLVPR